MCVLADDTLSLVLFLYIYIFNGIGKMQSNLCCLQFFIVVTKRFATTNTLSLSPENKRDAFLVVVVVVDDDDDDDFVVFKGRFFFDTHI